MIFAGNKKIKLFAGPTKVKAAYIGMTKVYPNSSLAVTQSLNFAAAGGSQVLLIQVEDGQSWSITGLPTGWAASATAGIGSVSVTITAPNNTTTAAKGATITVFSEDLTATCTLSQAAGAMVYGAWANTALIANKYTFNANGGTTYAYVEIARVWTWNGVPGSGGTETTASNLASATGYPSWISATANSLTCPSLGTTPRAQSDYVIECQSELASNRVSATFTQEANYVIEQQIMPGTLQFTPSYVSRDGGKAVCRTAYNATWEWKYSSGETTATAPPTEYGTISATNNFYASPEVLGATVDWLFGHVTWEGKTSSSPRSVTVIRDATKTLTPNAEAYPGAPTLVATQRYQGVSRQY